MAEQEPPPPNLRAIAWHLVPLLIVAALLLALAYLIHPAHGYERTAYMAGWPTGRDPAHPCRDVRQLVLARDAEADSVRWSGDGCRVEAGRWVDPYTAQLLTDPLSLDVDHVVPLGYVDAHGGGAWTPARKHAYASGLRYPRQLLAVSSSANRAKGDQGPSTWRPVNRTYWCRYAEVFGFVIAKEGLRAPAADMAALEVMGATCSR